MPRDAAKTDVDRSTARRSAREQWASAAVSEFEKACRSRHDDPGRSLEQLRKVLEGVAHAVRVARDDDFPSHRGTGLNRELLGTILPKVYEHLPRGLRHFVNTVKNLGDLHHHNQGETIEANPLQAQAMLLQCAALLEWLYEDVLDTPRPPAMTSAIDTLNDRGPVPHSVVVTGHPAAPRRGFRGALLGSGLAVVVGLAIGGWLLTRQTGAPSIPTGRGSPFQNLSQPERGFIEAYQNALESHDADGLVALHVIPTGRFFGSRNLDALSLRALFKGWFDKNASTRRTGFDRCITVYAASDGTRALTCDTYIDPPIPSGPSRVPTCLVFNGGGKVVSRVELRSVPSCPPPD